MQQAFIVSCFFVGCTVFAPTVWHLWIYSRSANANFYFGVTLAFATTQVIILNIISNYHMNIKKIEIDLEVCNMFIIS